MDRRENRRARMAPGRGDMKWTSEVPKEPGYYLVRRTKLAKPVIAVIDHGEEGLQNYAAQGFPWIENIQGFWFGPAPFNVDADADYYERHPAEFIEAAVKRGITEWRVFHDTWFLFEDDGFGGIGVAIHNDRDGTVKSSWVTVAKFYNAIPWKRKSFDSYWGFDDDAAEVPSGTDAALKTILDALDDERRQARLESPRIDAALNPVPGTAEPPIIDSGQNQGHYAIIERDAYKFDVVYRELLAPNRTRETIIAHIACDEPFIELLARILDRRNSDDKVRQLRSDVIEHVRKLYLAYESSDRSIMYMAIRDLQLDIEKQ